MMVTLMWSNSQTIHSRSEEHTSELQSQSNLVCRLLLEKKKHTKRHNLFQELDEVIHLLIAFKHRGSINSLNAARLSRRFKRLAMLNVILIRDTFSRVLS